MNPFIFALATGAATGICSFFFEVFNQSILRPFEPIQKITDRVKRKKLAYYFSAFVFLLMVLFIVEIYSLNDLGFAMVLGFMFALNKMFFQKGRYERKERAKA